jgi:hypothetical protein
MSKQMLELADKIEYGISTEDYYTLYPEGGKLVVAALRSSAVSEPQMRNMTTAEGALVQQALLASGDLAESEPARYSEEALAKFLYEHCNLLQGHARYAATTLLEEYNIRPARTEPQASAESITNITKRAIAAIEGQNWTDNPLTDEEKNLIEMAVMFAVRSTQPQSLSAREAILVQALEAAAGRFNMMAGAGLVNGADPKVGYRECMDALKSARCQAESDDYILPCDVKLPPATTITKGCTLSTLMAAFKVRERGWPEVSPEHVAAVDELLKREFRDGDWQTVESEEERHAIEHARFQADHASPDDPECRFDFDLVKTLLRVIDRSLTRPSAEVAQPKKLPSGADIIATAMTRPQCNQLKQEK